MQRMCRILIAAAVICGSAATAGAGPLSTGQLSPADDLLLSSNGGVADINGVSGPGSGGFGTVAANLNDGNRDGNYGDGSIAHSTAPMAGNYMEVTLPSAVHIGYVNVFNRTDCCSNRIDGNGTVPFTVNIFNGNTLTYTTSTDFIPTAALQGPNYSGMEISIPNAVGNRVQLVQNNSDWMNIAELEAYAPATSPVPEPASLTLLGLGGVGLALARRRRLA